MSPQRARAVLTFSVVILVVIGVAWSLGSSGERRADLDGQSVVAMSTSTSTTTTVDSPSTTTSTTPPPTTTVPPPTTPAAPAATRSTPRTSRGTQRLSIPALGVDAPVVAVGLNADGSMEIPGVSEAGWYWPGPRVGSVFGSAVIAAHVDYNGSRGVFFDLRKLGTGSNVSVTDDRGAVHTYVVTERFQVDKDELPTDEIFRGGGPHVLTLITCGGAFDSGAGHYQDNIVVRAVPA